jgi:hypothetical protein
MEQMTEPFVLIHSTAGAHGVYAATGNTHNL